MDYDNLRDRVVLVDGMSKSTVQVQVSVWVSGWFGSGHYETQTQQQVKVLESGVLRDFPGADDDSQ